MARLAGQIRDVETLDRVLLSADPRMRSAVLERFRKWLGFVPPRDYAPPADDLWRKYDKLVELDAEGVNHAPRTFVSDPQRGLRVVYEPCPVLLLPAGDEDQRAVQLALEEDDEEDDDEGAG